jgi:hypothetical protein
MYVYGFEHILGPKRIDAARDQRSVHMHWEKALNSEGWHYRIISAGLSEKIEPPAGRDCITSNGNDPGYHYPIDAHKCASSLCTVQSRCPLVKKVSCLTGPFRRSPSTVHSHYSQRAGKVSYVIFLSEPHL